MDYSKITDYAAKDLLLTGDPAKAIKGTEVGAEFDAIATMSATKEDEANKDATGGYAGLTLFKINFKNAANTFTSFFTNSNTAARTYTFQDRDGTIADDTDLGLKQSISGKDATGGYAGLTLFKINFKNAANTFTNFLTNATTSSRTWTFPDKDGTVAMTSDVGKAINQIVTTSVASVATGTTVIPNDNTIPQITEGDQYMSLAITPSNASSTLDICVECLTSNSVVNANTVALFQDATANALAATIGYDTTATGPSIKVIRHIMTAGTTSATTFRVRAGGTSAGTTTFNGSAGVQFFGGVCASRMTIKEYLP